MSPRSKFLDGPAAAWAFFPIALLVRLVGIGLLFSGPAYFSDERMYLRLADVVAHGNWLGEGTVAAPGPVYFWALLRLLGLSPAGMRVAQAVVGAATVPVVFLLARRIFGGRIAGLTALLLCGYPYLVYLAGAFYPQSIFQLTLAFTLYALLRYIQNDARTWLFLAGVGLGVSALFVVPLLSASPILAVWVLWAGRGSLGKRLRAAATLALVTVVVILPWTARNYAITRKFILISAMAPRSLYWANNDKADPYMRDPDLWLVRYQNRVDRETARQGMNEAEMDRHLSLRVRRFVHDHPGLALRNYLVRLSMFFDVAPRPYTSNVHTRSRLLEVVAILTSVPVLVLAPLGLWLGRTRVKLWMPLALLPLAQGFSYAAFNCSVRYRFPYEPYLILLAVVGFAGVVWPGWLEPRPGPGEREPSHGELQKTS